MMETEPRRFFGSGAVVSLGGGGRFEADWGGGGGALRGGGGGGLLGGGVGRGGRALPFWAVRPGGGGLFIVDTVAIV